jgi:hypothetical protein
VSACCQHNGHDEPFPPHKLLKAIATAMDLLQEAACHALLRDVLRTPEPADDDTYRRATSEIERCLTLARVACADALSHLEDES